MKTTLITTVFNEEKNIEKFFKSLFAQTKLPDEVIIVDGGSRDKTVEKLNEVIKKKKNKSQVKILQKKGNRSKGRNFAIENSSNEIILATDFGCVLDKNWVKFVSAPFKDKQIDVVSGYYKPFADSIFKKCLATYTCVMPDKIKENNFLPSSRSIAFRKKVWQRIKYPEWLDTCEDLVFAKKLKEKKYNFEFVREAVVFWEQKNNFKEAFFQFLNYAKGDGRAFYIRPQVPLIYLRYFLGIYFLFLSFLERSVTGLLMIPVFMFMYFLWSIKKNYKYIKKRKAFLILPALQILSDFAVLIGTTFGLLKRVNLKRIFSIIKNNKFIVFINFIYLILMLLTIDYGIPNKFHPFPYHMDEWHQLQAVRSTFAYGTPNVEGSANGTMLHFLISGFYLIPFTLLGIINPFELKIDNFINRENIFLILRFNTIIWGILSITLIYKIAESLKISKRLTAVLFTFNPIWLMLSGHFKYDISLMFFILLSIFFMLRYSKNPTITNFIAAGVAVGLALAVKISVLPLIPIYFLSFLIFHENKIKNTKVLFVGFLALVATALLFGFPDTLFGTGNIYRYLYENLIIFPSASSNFRSDGNALLYVFLKHYSIIFGYGLFTLFIFSLPILVLNILKGGGRYIIKNKTEAFFIASFLLFLSSLVTLKAYSGGNRALVLLPFIAILVSYVWSNLSKRNYGWFVGLFVFAMVIVQVYFSLTWTDIRNTKSIQAESSEWIEKYVPDNSLIGLENIPIYQNIPDILQKEFYFHEYNVGSKNRYEYQIVDSDSSKFPKVIVITNSDVEREILYKSQKTELIDRLKKEGYREVKVFKQNTEKLYLSDKDYVVAGLISSPLTIAIYKR